MNRYVFTQLKKEQNDTLLCVSGVRKRGKGGGGRGVEAQSWRPRVGGPKSTVGGEWRPKVGGPKLEAQSWRP